MPTPDEARTRLRAALDELAQPTPCALDPEHWYATAADDEHDPARLCRTCPVLDACRAYALVAAERFGVWGALIPADRGYRTGGSYPTPDPAMTRPRPVTEPNT